MQQLEGERNLISLTAPVCVVRESGRPKKTATALLHQPDQQRDTHPALFHGKLIARRYPGFGDHVFVGVVVSSKRATGQVLVENCIYSVFYKAQHGYEESHDDLFFEELKEGLKLFRLLKSRESTAEY